MEREQLSARDDGVGDDRRDFRELLLEKRCEATEVGERVGGPVDGYRARHGR